MSKETLPEANQSVRHSQRLKRIRNELGLSQEALAEKIWIDKKTYVKAEKGELALDATAAINLYFLSGYSLDWIYGVSDDERESNSSYHVDYRKLLRTENGDLVITLPSKLIKELHRIEKQNPEEEAELEMGVENEIPLYINYMSKLQEQQRRALYYCDDNVSYTGRIGIDTLKEVNPNSESTGNA